MIATSHLYVLLVLAEGDSHGYRMIQEIEELAEGRVRLGPGVLYAALGRLVDEGLITETEDRPVAELDDRRRRYYRITAAGRRELAAEVARMRRMIDRAGRLEPRWAAT